MAPNEERYSLYGGREGYARLVLLARDRWPETHALLDRAGVGAGMRCLDVGCGGGEVSLKIAEMVQPGGSVVGIDMDEVKLALGRAEAGARGIVNAEFRSGNANAWEERGAYDVVFTRFLLQHLRDPTDLLRRMWAAVRPGGRLVVEDADHEGWCSDPSNAAFEFQVRMLREVIEAGGGDPAVGRKLLRLFRDAGIPAPELSVVQPIRRGGPAAAMPVLTLRATRDSILAGGLATAEEVDAALADLAAFTEDPNTLISGPRIFQMWTRRDPAAP
jgi:SAM-dependent methyltransferase